MPKKVSWMWGGKRYSGTLIRETKTHKFARTHNGKIKKIKKQESLCLTEKEAMAIKEADRLKRKKQCLNLKEKERVKVLL